jgi:signal transduction histidine kinase
MFYNLLTISPIFNKKSELIYYVGIQYDITDIKKNEEKIYHLSKMASLSELISNISHHWRQPLSVISTAISSLDFKSQFETINPQDINDTYKSIIKNVQHLANIIDYFSNYQENISQNKEECNIKETINNSISLISSLINTNNIILDTKCHDNIYIKIDCNALIDIFIAFFNNSLDAFKVNKIEKKHIYINIKKIQDSIVITYTDNGGGISKENINKVFEPYFSTKHKSKDKGLSLNRIYKYVTEKLNGSIDVSSDNITINNQIYKSTTFKITINSYL